MILLPTKHLHSDRALITVGGIILRNVRTPIAFSELWRKTRDGYRRQNLSPLAYDVFLLALAMLYALRAIDYDSGVIRRVAP